MLYGRRSKIQNESFHTIIPIFVCQPSWFCIHLKKALRVKRVKVSTPGGFTGLLFLVKNVVSVLFISQVLSSSRQQGNSIELTARFVSVANLSQANGPFAQATKEEQTASLF